MIALDRYNRSVEPSDQYSFGFGPTTENQQQSLQKTAKI
ncbi:MAG: hypothetical protein ACJAS3_000827 [Roseivirga sp.]|jgi:hypothetical protein